MNAAARNPVKESPILEWLPGFVIFTVLLVAAFLFLPSVALDPGAKEFIFVIGMLAFWRYSWGLINFVRSLIYRRLVFPRWREAAEAAGDSLMPSKIYLLMTCYRIETETASAAIRAMVREAAECGVPVTIIASIVELQDEFMFRSIFEVVNPPDTVDLRIVRIAGTGKRDGLAQGFRAISRDMPDPDSVMVVIDADSILLPGTLRKCVPFFKMMPRLGALTTDEYCEVPGTALMREWHEMRFAQRHILMGSLALSRRVMTLTGRMSMFRATIAAEPEFIPHVTHDYLDHWRLGRFRFLTGDDKSSLYYVLKKGYEQIYVPDAAILTMEDPPSRNFVKASTQLMFRWFGNMMRTNARILALGPHRMPFFVWWAFLDQRISMWTSLSGPVFAVMLSIIYGPVMFAYYFVWVAFIRWVMTVMMLSARKSVSWRYPFLLYYNQIYGSLIKTWVMFRLDQQSWTRQKTKLQRGLTRAQARWVSLSSHAVHVAAVVVFVCAIGLASGAVGVPYGALRSLAGPHVIPWTG